MLAHPGQKADYAPEFDDMIESYCLVQYNEMDCGYSTIDKSYRLTTITAAWYVAAAQRVIR